MKIAFISDVHIGPSGLYKGVRRKLTEYSELYIYNFVKRLSSDYEFAIHLGDLIQDDNRENDLENYKIGLELFAKSSIPVHQLIGNHDCINLKQNELEEFIKQKPLYYSFDSGDYHFIILYTYVYDAEKSIIDEQQKAWLIADLAATNKPTLVFSHHSLADQNLFGNPWFQDWPTACLVENRQEIREILFDSQKIIAVVNGHLHWNNITHHDGIPYITVQSAIENYNDDGESANAWGIIEILDGKFSLIVRGNDPFDYEYEFL